MGFEYLSIRGDCINEKLTISIVSLQPSSLLSSQNHNKIVRQFHLVLIMSTETKGTDLDPQLLRQPINIQCVDVIVVRKKPLI